MHHKIAILDFGSQYAHLGARRLRALGVYTEILAPETPVSELGQYSGIIFSGGPASVYEEGAPTVDPKVFELGKPILGICYGHQLMTHLLGGKVEPGHGQGSEFGKTKIKIQKAEGIFAGHAREEVQVWMSHGDRVTALAPGFEILASSPDDSYSAIGDTKRHFYGLQFHPEVVHTLCGQSIYQQFLNLCGIEADWNIKDFIQEALEDIPKQVKERKVFMLVSGGVDSTVAFLLLNKALGPERLYGLLIDTGFLRHQEAETISARLHEAGFDNLHVLQAEEVFYKALEGVIEPEMKREIIGRTFLEVQRKALADLNLNPEEWMLGQGTIYPDTIETGASKHSAKIKTHHNRVPEIAELIEQGLVIEPLKELYKDEVREVGERLGLPHDLVWRHPFPGPGLAVRILCAKEADWPEAHQILEERIQDFLRMKGSKLSGKILPLKSVGVQGDFRTYRHPLLLQGPSDWDELLRLAPLLTNQFSEINRVLYLLAPEKLQNIAVTPGTLTLERVTCTQMADQRVMDYIKEAGHYDLLWQCPTILVPLSVNTEGKESLVLRPVVSEDVMTAHVAELPWEGLHGLAQKLLDDPRLSAVFYDITNKPPGTIEWE